MTARAVIVNADDLGIVPEVNQAVAAAYAAGSITSATMFAGADASGEAAALARESGLPVGLHLDLTLGRPLAPASKVPSLVDRDGSFLGRRRLALRAILGQVVSSEVALEVEAQLGALERMGIAPTHIDGHQHAHVLPSIAPPVVRVARRRGLAVRLPWVRFRWRAGPARLAKRAPLVLLNRSAHAHGAPTVTDDFTSVFDYGPPRRIDAALYSRMVRESNAAVLEVMVHPSRSSTELERIHPRLYPVALAEGAALVDPATASGLRATGARLVSFGDLSASRS